MNKLTREQVEYARLQKDHTVYDILWTLHKMALITITNWDNIRVGVQKQYQWRLDTPLVEGDRIYPGQSDDPHSLVDHLLQKEFRSET